MLPAGCILVLREGLAVLLIDILYGMNHHWLIVTCILFKTVQYLCLAELRCRHVEVARDDLIVSYTEVLLEVLYI